VNKLIGCVVSDYNSVEEVHIPTGNNCGGHPQEESGGKTLISGMFYRIYIRLLYELFLFHLMSI